ncbi:MAG: hypothetical protein LBG80_17150 [Bacteroidales bacterium]|jgi:predicted DNA repair protein MutK|nr:hypothetical protein [Bacteroidales bacterium]
MNTNFTEHRKSSPETGLELNKEAQMQLFKVIKWAKGSVCVNIIFISASLLTSFFMPNLISAFSFVFVLLVFFLPQIIIVFKYAKSAKASMLKSQMENEEGIDYVPEMEKSMRLFAILSICAAVNIVEIAVLLTPFLMFIM